MIFQLYYLFVDMKSYVVSVLLGHDMIPRTSFASLCKLRDDILNCICRAKVSKTYILQSLLRSADEIDSRDFLYESGQEPDTEFKRTIEKYIVRNFKFFIPNAS